MQHWIYLCLFMMVLTIHTSQAQSFGIRAGLNYSTFSGPAEANVEKNKLSNGFHFGFTYSYPIYESLSLRGEFMYSQYGNRLEYNGETYFRINTNTVSISEKGNTNIDLKVNNTYLGIPIQLQYTIMKKLEITFGGYINYLIQSRGAGNQRFESFDRPEDIVMRQTLSHNYKKDVAGGGSGTGPAVIVDKDIVYLFKNTGAYYQFRSIEKSGNLYKNLDYGLTGGISYFITKGFFVGLRYDYGLVDLTNNRMDPSKKSLDANGEFIFKNDFDRHIAYGLSMGFRF
jgi:hypothetical protein